MIDKLWKGLLIAAGVAIAATSARAGVIDDIKKRGELVIGVEAQYTPYEFFKDGEIIGYDIDILNKFAKVLGVKLKVIDTEWNGIIPSLLAKKFDAILSGMTITKERAQKLSFAMPYAEATNVVLVRADEATIKTAEDIAGKRVGAQISSAGDKLLNEFEVVLKGKGKPGYTEHKTYDHYPEAYVDLTNKRVDAIINSLSTLAVLMKEQPGKYKIVDGIQNLKAYYGMAIRQDDPDLLKFANEQFAELKKSGELKALQIKWFGQPMETPNEVPAELP